MIPQLPFEQPGPLQVAATLRELQDRGPIHRVRTRTGDHAWLVTDYAQVRALLADDRLGRAHPDPGNAARSGDSVLFGGPLDDFDTEQADHHRMRSLLQPHFTPKRMRALGPRVDELTTELLGALTRRERPADLIDALAVPLPILVICELLGVPYEDREQFRAWTDAAADVGNGARSEHGLGELFDYGRRLVAVKRRSPGNDVISRLLEVDDVGDDEAAMLSMALLFAGHETTVVQIGMGALALLADPGQYEALAIRPELVAGAVEEILRAPVQGGGGIPRYARTDLDICGTAVAAGDLVLCDIEAADHDPAVFAAPERFDIARRETAHLAFGHGARFCIGAPLARIELRAVFSQLTSSFPTMRLAVPVEELAVRTDVLTGGLVELPVRW